MNQPLLNSTRYIFQTVMDPFAVEPPQGYRLHSWREKTARLVSGPVTVMVCWERESDMVNHGLFSLPAEWVAPGLDIIKRWVLKHT